jgi:transcription elongation factor GreA
LFIELNKQYLINFLFLLIATLQVLVALYFFCLFLKQLIMSEINYVTMETFELMKQELHKLKAVERPAASRAIADAREKGDLKENAEYDAAKEAQGILEAKIKQLEGTIATAKIVDTSTIDTSKVTILTRVTITNMATKKTVTYQIVGEKEADLKAGKISASSPIGKGLIGKLKGEIAEVQAPTGVLKFKVDDITV